MAATATWALVAVVLGLIVTIIGATWRIQSSISSIGEHMSSIGDDIGTVNNTVDDLGENVGGLLHNVLTRAIAATVVLVVFVGIAALVWVGRLQGGAVVFFAGLIIGYLLRASKDPIR